jgi:hypothetical protein
MRQIIGPGILGGVALAALALGVPRDADACNTIPPENDCSVTRVGTTVYYARVFQTVATPPGQNCGCGQALGDLASGASVVAGGVFSLSGNPTTAFCGSGPNAQTTAAFGSALPGVNWTPSAVLSAVSAGGVVPGQLAYGIWKVVTSAGGFDGTVGVAQVNFGPGGSVTLDPQHQAIASINVQKCADCSVTPFARACTATQAARPHLDNTVVVPSAKAVVACAVTDAPALLGLPVDEEPQAGDGGCSASRGRVPALAVMLGLLGLALAIGRARRRT